MSDRRGPCPCTGVLVSPGRRRSCWRQSSKEGHYDPRKAHAVYQPPLCSMVAWTEPLTHFAERKDLNPESITQSPSGRPGCSRGHAAQAQGMGQTGWTSYPRDRAEAAGGGEHPGPVREPTTQPREGRTFCPRNNSTGRDHAHGWFWLLILTEKQKRLHAHLRETLTEPGVSRARAPGRIPGATQRPCCCVDWVMAQCLTNTSENGPCAGASPSLRV